MIPDSSDFSVHLFICFLIAYWVHWSMCQTESAESCSLFYQHQYWTQIQFTEEVQSRKMLWAVISWPIFGVTLKKAIRQRCLKACVQAGLITGHSVMAQKQFTMHFSLKTYYYLQYSNLIFTIKSSHTLLIMLIRDAIFPHLHEINIRVEACAWNKWGDDGSETLVWQLRIT